MARAKLTDDERRERNREASKRYRLRNPGVATAATRRWQKRNPEKHKAHYRTYAAENYVKQRMSSIKARAKRNGLEFNLTIEDFVIPDVCPVLGIPMDKSRREDMHEHSASLDRINNNKGYVKGNVMWMSRKANTMKNNATNEELMKVALYFNRLSSQTEAGSSCGSDPAQ